jgi:hypothetical protein
MEQVETKVSSHDDLKTTREKLIMNKGLFAILMMVGESFLATRKAAAQAQFVANVSTSATDMAQELMIKLSRNLIVVTALIFGLFFGYRALNFQLLNNLNLEQSQVDGIWGMVFLIVALSVYFVPKWAAAHRGDL